MNVLVACLVITACLALAACVGVAFVYVRISRTPLIQITRPIEYRMQWQWCSRCERAAKFVPIHECPMHGLKVRST